MTACVLLWLLAAAVLGATAGAEGQQGHQSMPAKPIEEVLRQHTPWLMALPGVVGTAQGECAGRPCIKVYVVEKTAELVRQIPADIEGFAVVIEETGTIRARDPR